MTIWIKDKCQILAYHVNNTYAKLAPDSILNKKIEEIMRYTGGHRTFPLFSSDVKKFRLGACESYSRSQEAI